jgi:hypothetical protein
LSPWRTGQNEGHTKSRQGENAIWRRVWRCSSFASISLLSTNLRSTARRSFCSACDLRVPVRIAGRPPGWVEASIDALAVRRKNRNIKEGHERKKKALCLNDAEEERVSNVLPCGPRHDETSVGFPVCHVWCACVGGKREGTARFLSVNTRQQDQERVRLYIPSMETRICSAALKCGGEGRSSKVLRMPHFYVPIEDACTKWLNLNGRVLHLSSSICLRNARSPLAR